MKPDSRNIDENIAFTEIFLQICSSADSQFVHAKVNITIATAKLSRYTDLKNRRSLRERRSLTVGRRSLNEFRNCGPRVIYCARYYL